MTSSASGSAAGLPGAHVGTEPVGKVLRESGMVRAAADKELPPDYPPDYPPAGIGLLPGDGDEYVITDGGMKGLRGFFTRDQTGAVTGVDLAGRLFNRVPTAHE